MDKKAIMAIAVVSILVVAGAAVYFIGMGGGEENKKVEYDPAKGWYSWDPIVVKYPTGKMSLSPQLVDEVEKMYIAIYGELPDYSKYKASDVPKNFLKYNSFISNETAQSLTIVSSIRTASGSSDYEHISVTIPKGTNHLVTVGSNAAMLKMMLESQMSSTEAEAKVWEIIYGIDKSAYPGGTASLEQYGMTIPDTVVKVNSTYYMLDNIDAYTKYVEDCTKTADDNLICMFSGALKEGYADLKPFYDMLDAASPGHAYLVGTFCNNLSDVFASVEMLGAMFDLKDAAHNYLDSIRLKFYAMSQESAKKNLKYSAYIESTAGTAGGKGTIINDVMTNILSLKNIADHEQWKKISDEIVIEEQPKVLIFQSTDKRTDDERMRVNTGLVTT